MGVGCRVGQWEGQRGSTGEDVEHFLCWQDRYTHACIHMHTHALIISEKREAKKHVLRICRGPRMPRSREFSV